MKGAIRWRISRCDECSAESSVFFLSAGGLATATPAGAQALVEFSAEARFQLDLHVPDATLLSMLPAGFTPNVAMQGPAKDWNLRAIFVGSPDDQRTRWKPVGKGSSRLVYLAAPVKDPNGANAQVVIGGIVDDPADAPGPFGVYIAATTTHTMQRATSSSGDGPAIDSQDWVFHAPTGRTSRVAHHVRTRRSRTRGTPQRGSSTRRRTRRRCRRGDKSRCSTSCVTQRPIRLTR